MLRTALRLGILPLLAALVVFVGESVPIWQWFAIGFLSPFVFGILLSSFWRLKRDPIEGAVPRWARRLTPWVWAVSVIIILSVPLTSWPLHLSFKYSRHQLEQLLAEAQSGKPIVWPQTAGAFEILDLDIDANESYFYLSDGGPPTTLRYSASLKSPKQKLDLSQDNSVVILSENWVYSEPFD